ncbi:MAG: carboxy terminal-processing peptidase [Bacteroidota bacterium]|nr:carboxy terminal-processing peptidase [Bacteroidota bacterium]
MKKRIFIFGAILFSATFLLSCLFSNDEKQEVVAALTYNLMKNYHYEKIDFNDDFSQQVFDKYIEYLDFSKRYLLQSDIRKMSRNIKKLSEQIQNADLNFFKESYEIIVKRREEAQLIYEDIISKPFNLNKKENIISDSEKQKFASNNNELTEYWRKLLKLEILIEVDNQLSVYEKKKQKGKDVEEKSLEQLEIDARAKIKKNYDDYFDRLSKLREEDYFSLYINAITYTADPHSQYYAPKNKEDFDIYMSGELEGIGATLSQRFGEIKIVSIIVGGAAWKNGELEEGDVILDVAQENEEAVNIVSMRLDDAVRLIRGKKGTKVILTVKKIDESIKQITIVRDKIIVEETYVRTVILKKSNSGKRVAYIYFPSFYIDFNKKNGRKCSEDLRKELYKLKEENVDGIIIDLRNNGGGSLQEVVTIAGFFIPKGPIVQVKDRRGVVGDLSDKDASVLYEGNLLIMSNQFSASASEIFAAAMQDYNRAVIFGTKQSLGKGTVQQMFNLDNAPRIPSELKPLGGLKMTIQKFYRINGGSTQMKGVISDITFSTVYSYLKTGESSLDNALPWDKISPLSYKKWSPSYNIDSLKKWSLARMANDSAFIVTDNYAKFLKNEDENNIIPLNLKKYRIEKQGRTAKRKEFNKATKKKMALNIDFLTDDKNVMKNDTVFKYRYENWSKKLKKDYKLSEAYRIVVDMSK